MSNNLEAGLAKAAIRGATRHVFVCIGPDCCKSREGEALWEYIKKRVKETGAKAMRTKAACLRICTDGPWVVIYPEGTWYGNVTPGRFERILQEHVLRGEPVLDWVVARNALEPAEGGPQERTAVEV